MNGETLSAVCPDCGASYPVDKQHRCSSAVAYKSGQRLAALLLDERMLWCTSGVGLLWLYRVAYRVRSHINGLQKYKDRADMARRVCVLNHQTRLQHLKKGIK